MAKVIGVRFKAGGKVYYFDPGALAIERDDYVVVETSRGTECGEVCQGIHEVPQAGLVGPLKPVLRLANANFKADIDAMNNGELIGFCQKSGADPMAGGSAARVIFYDTNQPALSFKQKEITLQNGISCISFEAEVSAYEGAIPYENPLLGLKIRRTFALTSDGLKISISLFNPSKHNFKVVINQNLAV